MATTKSIIIAGGKGIRLRDLCDYEPKHILPIANKPLVEYHIDELENYSPVRFSYSKHNKEFWDTYFSEKPSRYSHLIPKLDTTLKGPLYPLLELLTEHDKNDYIIGITGDAFGIFDLEDMIKFHLSLGRPITIGMSRTYPSPKACVFDVDEKKKTIKGMYRENGVSKREDLINIGVYIASPELLKEIPLDLCSYKEDSIFPLFIKKGIASAYVLREKAVNVNTPYQYFCANMHALQIFTDKKNSKRRQYIIGDGTNIDNLDNIYNTVIGKKVTIGRNVKLRNVIVMDGSIVEDTDLENTIIKKGVECRNVKGKNIIIGKDYIKEFEVFEEFD